MMTETILDIISQPMFWLNRIIYVQFLSVLCLILVRITEKDEMMMGVTAWVIYGLLTIIGMFIERQILNRTWR